MENIINYPQGLEVLRVNMQLTKSSFAEKIDISLEEYNNFLNKKAIITETRLEIFCKVLDFDMEILKFYSIDALLIKNKERKKLFLSIEPIMRKIIELFYFKGNKENLDILNLNNFLQKLNIK